MGDILFSLFGLAVLLALTWALSEARRRVDLRLILSGVALQYLFALIVLKTSAGAAVFDAAARFFVGLVGFAQEGARFVLGSLVDVERSGFIFAAQVLPPLIFFASLMAVLYHLGLMQRLVAGTSWVMERTMRISGAESLSVAANVFVGQTEAPLVIRPFLAGLTRSEFFTMMVGGMATTAGGMLAAYIAVLAGDDPVQQLFYAKHLLAASFMSAPATIVVAKIMIPEQATPETLGRRELHGDSPYANAIEAAAGGAEEGVKLAINVGAMVLAFIALIAMLNYPLGALGEALNLSEPLDLGVVFGYVLAPVAWVVGTPWADAVAVGGYLGEKVVFNEFIAYLHLARDAEALQPRSLLVATYALCGFANFGSIAVQIGGIGTLAPSRRTDLAVFGIRSIVGGTIAALMTAAIAAGLS